MTHDVTHTQPLLGPSFQDPGKVWKQVGFKKDNFGSWIVYPIVSQPCCPRLIKSDKLYDTELRVTAYVQYINGRGDFSFQQKSKTKEIKSIKSRFS